MVLSTNLEEYSALGEGKIDFLLSTEKAWTNWYKEIAGYVEMNEFD